MKFPIISRFFSGALPVPRVAREFRISLMLMLASAGIAIAAPASAQAAENCEALSKFHQAGVVISAAAGQAAGEFQLPDKKEEAPLPAFCRVVGKIQGGQHSTIGFELWIPPSNEWNGKLLVVGNGGYVGSIQYHELAPAIRRGYAVVSSDSGHVDTSAYRHETLQWGADHPEKIADWAERSTHAAAEVSKVLVKQLKGRNAGKSYFFGCSTGGGQALMAAQRYPQDFDGIIAGAPGFRRTGLNEGFLWMAMQNLKSTAGYIPAAKLAFINHAAIAACGAGEGVIDDPRRCHFDPSTLQCKDNLDGPSCLTGAQIATLKTLYSGAVNARTGEQVYPGWPVGSEFGYAGGWGYAIEGPQPFRLEFFRDWVFKDSQWDWRTFDWDKDLNTVNAVIGHTVDATDPDLSAYKKHGGKLILYHGWADPIGNAYDTINYYEKMAAKTKDAPSFARLFLMPGMGHCRGGEGPNSFDAIGTLDKWVESDQPPSQMIALKSATTDETGGLAGSMPDKSQGKTRPICAYPQVAKYRGKGSTEDAASFVCSKSL
jgi:feruloyl esterase